MPSLLQKAWSTRGITLGLLAAVTACMGQALLFLDGQRRLGFALVVAAMALGGVAWGQIHEMPLLSLTTDQQLGIRDQGSGIRLILRRSLVIRFAAIAGSLLLSIGSLLAWFADPDEVFGLKGVLWVASICLFVSACVSWRSRASGDGQAGLPWTRLEIAMFAELVVLALFTYLAGLNDIPWRFHFDEAIAYQESMRFYRGPQISVFTTTWFDTGLPSMWFALSGALMHLVGTDLGGVRFSVALAGALTVAPVYGLGRLLIGRAGAALAAFGWATTPVAIHYSRVSIINSTTAFFWAGCFFFLLKGLRSRKPLDFALSGLLAGLSMYTYYGTRLLPYLLLAFGAYLALIHQRAFRERAAQLALVPVGFVVGFGPLLAYFLRNPGMWAGRGLRKLVVPPTIPLTWGELSADWNILAPLLRLNFLGLSVIPSNDRVYWGAFLLPVEAAVMLLGVGVLVWRWRQPGAFLILLWGVGVLFVGGTLVDAAHTPAFAHWTPAFPAFFLAMALPPALWLQALRRWSKKWWRWGCVVVGAGVVALACVNAYTYLVAYPAKVPPSFEAAQGRFLSSLTSSQRVRFMGNSWQSFYSLIGEMMAPDVEASDLLNPGRSLPVRNDGREMVFVFHNDQTQYLPLIETYYPGGERGQIETPGGPIGQTYRVPAQQALSRHGVWLTLTGENGTDLWQGKVDSIGSVPTGTPLQPRFPLTATWSGWFFSDGQEVGLTIEGPPLEQVRLWVEGAPVEMGTPIRLEEGWAAFTVEARLTQLTPTRALLEEGTTGIQSIELERRRLWPRPANGGLFVTLQGANVNHRIDPLVGASIFGGGMTEDAASRHLLLKRDPDFIPVASRREETNLVRWEGEVYTESGEYKMDLRTDARARLRIDGNIVLDLCDNVPPPNSVYSPAGHVFVQGGYPVTSTVISLEQGWHSVRLDLEAYGTNSGLEWAWTRPDGVREVVPPQVLRHSPALYQRAFEASRIAHPECGMGDR